MRLALSFTRLPVIALYVLSGEDAYGVWLGDNVDEAVEAKDGFAVMSAGSPCDCRFRITERRTFRVLNEAGEGVGLHEIETVIEEYG